MIYLAFDYVWSNTFIAGEWAAPNAWGPLPLIGMLMNNFPERYAVAHTSKLLEADVRFAYLVPWRYHFGYGTALHAEHQRDRMKKVFWWLKNSPILPGLRNGKIKLVFVDWYEGDVDPTNYLLPGGNDYKFQVLAQLLDVPIKSMVYVHADAWAAGRSHASTAPHYVYENSFENSALADAFIRRDQQGEIGEHPLDKPLRFLSYSRHWNEYRQMLTLELMVRGLDKFGLISCGSAPEYYNQIPGDKKLSEDLPTWASSDVELEVLRSAIPQFMEKLPMVLDFDLSINLTAHVTYDHFLQTDLSLVNETWVNDRQVFITEKTFKTMLLKHPFLMFGSPGTLAHLRELGYKTFWPYLDESYDDEPHLPTRKNKILKVLDDFCRLSREHRLELRQHLDEIANFNYAHANRALERKLFGRNLTNFLSNIFEREYLGAV